MRRNAGEFHKYIQRQSDKLDLDIPERNACFCNHAERYRRCMEYAGNLYRYAHRY